jgi:hypothetical protein
MISTPTTRNRLNNQSTGSNRQTWGNKLNTEVFDLIDESLDGVETVNITGAYSLTATNYVSDQARNRGLKFTDTGTALTGGVTITLPSNEKLYWIINDTLQTLTFDAGGTTGAVEAGRRKWISVDASDNVDVGEDGADKEYVDATFLKLAGGALTGALTLSGAPTVDLHAATKAYADLMIPLAGGTPTGLLNYGSDLSGSYTDRSLVDKAYVQSVALGSVSVSFAWADVTGKPTTIAGYGITDAYTKTETDAAYQPLDSDLTAIAALTTTARGRSELTTPNAAHIDNTDSPYAASFGEEIFVDCSTGAVEVDLPAATAGSLPIRITDDDGSSVTNNITIDPNLAETIAGQTTIEIDQARASIKLVPFAGVWRIEK